MQKIALLLPHCRLWGPAHTLPIDITKRTIKLGVDIAAYGQIYIAQHNINFVRLAKISLVGNQDNICILFKPATKIKNEYVEKLTEKILKNKLWKVYYYTSLGKIQSEISF